MISTSATRAAAMPVASRYAAQGRQASTLTDIYRERINIAIWRRDLSASMQDSIKVFLASNSEFKTDMVVTPNNALTRISERLTADDLPELNADIADLVEMFCDLFERTRVGLRMQVLDHAMCPKFHVDRVPCRLVTTYQGAATEWLPHEVVDQTKLGQGSRGQPDHRSGLYRSQSDIQQLGCGDVALLKGVLWQGNEQSGLTHRSPEPSDGEQRLLLTLDFVD